MAGGRRSLLFWVALALTVAAVFPAAIGLFQLRSNRHALLDQVQRMQILAASTAADRVSSHVASLRREAEVVTRDPLMADLTDPAAHERLAELLQQRSELFAAAVLGPHGEQVVLAQRRDARELVADALAAPPGGETEIGGTPQRWLWLRQSLDAEGRQLVLVAGTHRMLEILLRADQVGEAETVLVSDSAETLLGDPALLSELPPQLIPQIQSAKLLAGAGRYRDDSGREVIAAHHPVANTPWLVVSRQPRAAADAAQRRMQVATLSATLGALFIAAALSFLGYRLLVRPIRRLVRAQAEVAGIDELPAGGSEIEQLESTFAQLLLVEQERESIGEVFLGRYRVVGKLGRGGSGTVFKGFDPVLQRAVALKAVPLAPAGDEADSLVSKLQAEAVHLARLNHPNIVSVFDFEQKGDTAYIAMEEVDGVSMAEYLSQKGPLPVREGVAIAVAVNDALAAAHGVDLIHGDMKPGNILLGKDGSIKVADFGTSQLMRGQASTGQRLEGTAGYIAPEVLKRHGTTRASDLFSLGVVLYEMFAGRRPFGRGSIADVLRRTLKGTVEPLGEVRTMLPAELSNLVMSLLAADPKMRPGSAEAVADILVHLNADLDQDWKLDLEGVLDEPPSKTARPTDYLTRYLGDA